MIELPPPYSEKGWTIDEIAKDDLFTADQMRSYGEQCALVEREAIRRLVLDDAWALTFQTFGQYRSALAAAIRKGPSAIPE